MGTALKGRTHGCSDQRLRREDSSCQPGAVHTWPEADLTSERCNVRCWGATLTSAKVVLGLAFGPRTAARQAPSVRNDLPRPRPPYLACDAAQTSLGTALLPLTSASSNSAAAIARSRAARSSL